MKYSTLLMLMLLGVLFVVRPIRACGGGDGEGGGEGEGDPEGEDTEDDEETDDEEGDDEGDDEGEEEADCECEIPDEEVNEHCKSKVLKGIMTDAYDTLGSDKAAIMDAIQANAAKMFGAEFEVHCVESPNDIGFRNWYAKNKICKWPGPVLTCVAHMD